MIPDPSRTERELKQMALQEMERNNSVGFSWFQRFLHPSLGYFLNASAYVHDENYRAGGDEYDRLIADTGFIKRMFQDIEKQPLKRTKADLYWRACWYYIIVRTFGWLGFKHKNRTMSLLEIAGGFVVSCVITILKAFVLIWFFGYISSLIF